MSYNEKNISSSCSSDSPQFPVPAEIDHCSMLRKVRSFPYEMPLSFSPPFALLITEVISLSVILVLLAPGSRFVSGLMSDHGSSEHLFVHPAFVQDSRPPPQDHRSFQTTNLLLRINLRPRSAAAPAHRGNL